VESHVQQGCSRDKGTWRASKVKKLAMVDFVWGGGEQGISGGKFYGRKNGN